MGSAAIIEVQNVKENLAYADARALDLLTFIVSAIVDQPHAVRITPSLMEDGCTFTITAHSNDVGRLMCRHGLTANAMRVVMAGVGMKSRKRYAVVVADAVVLTTRT
jgi:uncharacterized protein